MKQTLINLAIEKLENMAPTGAHNYDFVCLQATENSVPFYEAMGFVRIGAILENDKFEEERRGQQQQKQQQEAGSPDSVPSLDSESSATSSIAAITADAALGSGLGLVETTPGVFSSPVNSYVVKKPWERIEEVAKKFSVDVWDIIFLNKEVYEDIMPRSWLKKGTKLFVPSDKARANAISDALRAKERNGDDKSEAPLWYTARENDTPKMIAKMFDQKVSELIAANRDRLPGLIGTSRLKESTRVKVSRFDLHDDHHVPYCHWTFPDDSFKDSEPSYMMARRLHRGGKKSKAKKSLAVPVQEYLHIEDEKESVAADAEMEEAEKVELSAPVKPKKPMSAYMIYSTEQRKALKRENPGMSIRELKKLMSAKWKDLPGIDKAKWEDKVKAAKKAYDTEMKQYEKDLKEFRKANPDWDANKAKKKDDGLVNAVVKLTGHEEGDGGFEYYYVLTYIPDLQVREPIVENPFAMCLGCCPQILFPFLLSFTLSSPLDIIVVPLGPAAKGQVHGDQPRIGGPNGCLSTRLKARRLTLALPFASRSRPSRPRIRSTPTKRSGTSLRVNLCLLRCAQFLIFQRNPPRMMSGMYPPLQRNEGNAIRINAVSSDGTIASWRNAPLSSSASCPVHQWPSCPSI